MTQYLVSRLLQSIIVIIGVTFFAFMTLQLAGDPTYLYVSDRASEQEIATIRERLGFDRPLHEQYITYMVRMVQGDFGTSLVTKMPALDLVMTRLPATIELACAAMAFSLLVAVPFGVLSAVYRGSWLDSFGKGFAMLGQAMPNFWIGLLMILFFAIHLNWLPAYGRGGWSHLVMPAIALGWYPVAAMTRIVRSGMLDVLDSDYIRMARAVGAPERVLIWKYAFRNAAIPLVTVLGVYFAAALGGAFVVEVVFAWPGLGRTVVEAVFARDFPVVQAGVLVASVLFVTANLLVDLSYGLIDPRIRHDR